MAERPTVKWHPADVRAVIEARDHVFAAALLAEEDEDSREPTLIVDEEHVLLMASESRQGDVTPPPRRAASMQYLPPPPIVCSSEYERALSDVAAVLTSEISMPAQVVSYLIDLARARGAGR